jgi:BASS family bile acid:Na+ symporter
MLQAVGHFLAAHVIALFMLTVGLRTDRLVLRELTERWRDLLRALAIVWLGVPLLALAVVHVAAPSPFEAMVLVVLAICPGKPLALRHTKRAHGHHRMSLLVIISTALTAIVLVPGWAFLVSRFTPHQLAFGPDDVAAILVPTVLAPYAVGWGIHMLSARVARVLAQVVEVLFFVGLALFVATEVLRGLPGLWGLTLTEILAAVAISLGAAILGYVASTDPTDRRIAVAYAAALGNPALALGVLAHSEHAVAISLVAMFVVLRALALVPFDLWLHLRHRAPRPELAQAA